MESNVRIMVVDDEVRICENVEKILKRQHYEIEHATSAAEALEKMAEKSFSLLISDIVMPGKNGLELLKIVKDRWPLTKAVMMTAYASTDTAVKAIRMGALDYIPKPFTPDELRNTVAHALNGELIEADTSAAERRAINVIDIDIPFDRDEVSQAVGDAYADMLGPSDMPVVEVKARAPLEHFCEVGSMVCDMFKKLGATCKTGNKTGECPLKKAQSRKAANPKGGFDPKRLIGIDEPFSYEEVASVTGPEYILNLQSEGISVPHYAELKENVARMLADDRIAPDAPFSRGEVAKAAGEAYADMLGPSDMPVVEVRISESLENFCETGEMVCDIFRKLGATCKAGTKTGGCPQKKAKTGKSAARPASFDGRRHIGPDMPFDIAEVAAAAGTDYVDNLVYDGVVQVPYGRLKENIARLAREAEASTAPRILVIDDEVAVNNNIRKILSKQGYRVAQAVTKAEAMEKINAEPYQLVLLDLKIPGVRDLELLRAVMDHQPDAKVVIITGYASIETAVETARMGAVAYLPKPFSPAEIRSATDQALRLAA